MNDAEKPRECITHFNACDCREEKFARLQKQNEILRERIGLTVKNLKMLLDTKAAISDYMRLVAIRELQEEMEALARADELEGK